jgi:aspartate racemase
VPAPPAPEERFLRAARAYRPAPYPGQLAVFRAEGKAALGFDRQLWWGPLAAGGVEVHEIPGTHVDCITHPHVAVLGARLRACLGRAAQPQGTP